MPSAMPRNIENDPSVTMIGGIPSRVIKSALSAPPAKPSANTTSAAAKTGIPPSRHTVPNTTAERPIMDPTDRSMPPVIITGVSASASRPSSTLSLTTSKKLAVEKKFSPSAENRRTSKPSAASKTHSPFGKQRSRQCLRSLNCKLACISPHLSAQRVDGHGRQDDSALQGPFPIRTDAQKGQGRTDHTEQHHPEQCADHRSSSARDRRAAHDHRRNHLHLHPDPCIAGDLVETNRIEQRPEPGERARQGEHPEHNAAWIDSRQACRGWVRAGRVNRASRPQMAQTPAGPRHQHRRRGDGDCLAYRLRLTEPLKRPRQILHPRALGSPSQAVAKRHHGSQGYDDRGNSGIGDQRPVDHPQKSSGQARSRRSQRNWRSKL